MMAESRQKEIYATHETHKSMNTQVITENQLAARLQRTLEHERQVLEERKQVGFQIVWVRFVKVLGNYIVPTNVITSNRLISNKNNYLFIFVQGTCKMLSQIGQDKAITEQQVRIVKAQMEKIHKLKKVQD